MLTDTHAHLFWDSFKPDYDAVIDRALQAGVTEVINVGVDYPTSLQATQLEGSKIKFYSTIGIHPHEAIKLGSTPKAKIQLLISQLEQIYFQFPQKVKAVGECGLDYFFNPDFMPVNLTFEQVKQLQKKLLTAQVDLAKKLNLPLTIHCRDDRSQNPQNSTCWNDTLAIIKNHKGVLHCYSGLEATTKRVIEETSFLISFAATLTYSNNQYLLQAAKIIPLDRIVLETDCPFLPPQSNRGQRNEPATIRQIAETIAQIKGLTLDQVATQTTQNAKTIFNLN